MPPFSNAQDASSEESILFAITREMYNRHIRVIVIRATDVLDTIFVARFVRRNLPNARIVITDDEYVVGKAIP